MANPLRGLLPGLFRNGGKGEGSTRPWCRRPLALLNEAAAVCGLALADTSTTAFAELQAFRCALRLTQYTS